MTCGIIFITAQSISKLMY